MLSLVDVTSASFTGSNLDRVSNELVEVISVKVTDEVVVVGIRGLEEYLMSGKAVESACADDHVSLVIVPIYLNMKRRAQLRVGLEEGGGRDGIDGNYYVFRS